MLSWVYRKAKEPPMSTAVVYYRKGKHIEQVHDYRLVSGSPMDVYRAFKVTEVPSFVTRVKITDGLHDIIITPQMIG